ncbi:sodium/potassium/calcium exchanger 3-like protein, partial [Dinothrombium tinctorium]
MALSNTIGSNIFDIEVCLSLPWFIKTVIFGESIHLHDKNLVVCVIILFASVWISISLLSITRWRLTKTLGSSFILFYLAFI